MESSSFTFLLWLYNGTTWSLRCRPSAIDSFVAGLASPLARIAVPSSSDCPNWRDRNIRHCEKLYNMLSSAGRSIRWRDNGSFYCIPCFSCCPCTLGLSHGWCHHDGGLDLRLGRSFNFIICPSSSFLILEKIGRQAFLKASIEPYPFARSYGILSSLEFISLRVSSKWKSFLVLVYVGVSFDLVMQSHHAFVFYSARCPSNSLRDRCMG